MCNKCSVKLYGIVGRSLQYSLSPAIYGHLFRRCGLNCVYSTFDATPKQFPDVINALRILGTPGFNVTYPYKETIVPLLDRVSSTARQVGAVNTVAHVRGRLSGYNTDVFGIRSTLRDRLRTNLKGQEVVVLGSGGAARACIFELLRQKVGKIMIVNRTRKKAEHIVDHLCRESRHVASEVRDFGCLDDLLSTSRPELIINATSAAPAEIEKIIRPSLRRQRFRGTLFWDLNYGSRALAHTRRPGPIRYEDGLYMLAAQAALSFRIWTGEEVLIGAVYRFLKRELSRR